MGPAVWQEDALPLYTHTLITLFLFGQLHGSNSQLSVSSFLNLELMEKLVHIHTISHYVGLERLTKLLQRDR
jgi:hypothetical protein